MRYTREDGCRAWLAYGILKPAAMTALLEEYGSGEAAYDRFRQHGRTALEPFANEQQLDILSQRAEPEAMHEMMRVMQTWEMGILTQESEDYPEALRNIPDSPFQLFYRGDPRCLFDRCVTMIGSRKASCSGERAAYRVARELSEQGVCVVSGLAVGIDTAALNGGLDGGTPVAGILGCGLDVDYPASNRGLKEKIIASGGVLMSEYPPGTPAWPGHFPVRNRIMSGLSSAVLMMEAQIRSGSMTTVQHALDQGREVYAYPGEPGTPWAEGAHLLLREGANYFATAQDILEDMGWQSDQPEEVPVQSSKTLPALTADQQKVYALVQRGDTSYEELIILSGMEPSALSGALTMLQIMGLVESLPGKVYKAV